MLLFRANQMVLLLYQHRLCHNTLNYLTPQFYPCQHIRYILSVSFSDSLSCDDSISKINKNIFLGRSKTFPNI